MSSRVRLELVSAKEGEHEVIGPFNSKVLLSFLSKKYSSDAGEVSFADSEAAADFCHELIDLCKALTLPTESDDIGVHDTMMNLAAITSIYVNLQRIKPNNRRYTGYSLRWG